MDRQEMMCRAKIRAAVLVRLGRGVIGMFLTGLWLAAAALAGASGLGEEPEKVVSKTYSLGEYDEVELDGQITFSISQGPEPRIEVRASHALFDQLKVVKEFGRLIIRTDTGQFGAREPGEVTAKIVLTSLRFLEVRDRSVGKLDFKASDPLEIVLKTQSRLESVLDVGELKVRLSWNSALTVKGRTASLQLESRQKSLLRANELAVPQVRVQMENASHAFLNAPEVVFGALREKSVLEIQGLSSPKIWPELEVLEESKLDFK